MMERPTTTNQLLAELNSQKRKVDDLQRLLQRQQTSMVDMSAKMASFTSGLAASKESSANDRRLSAIEERLANVEQGKLAIANVARGEIGELYYKVK